MGSFKSIAYLAPRYVEFTQDAATVPATGYLFVADEYYEVVSVKARFSHVGGASAAVTINKVPSGTAPGSGTAVLSAAVDLTATADTTYSGTISSVAGAKLLAPGDALAAVFSGTLTALTGLVVQVTLKPTKVTAITR